MKVSRRGFGAIAASLSVPLSGHAGARNASLPSPVTLIKPPRLRFGATVGLIAPGGYISERTIDKAVRNIESLGLKVKQGKYLREVFGNYAGSVEQRVADLHAMFTDPEIRMIWPIRGGSGCISLLAHLDYDLIRRHPKILLGYSDISALHLAIHKQAGLVTFHGPVASSTMTDYSRAQMMAVLADPQHQYTIPMSPENARQAASEPHFGIHTHTHGVATGALMGGNLSMVAALAGTPYAAHIRDSILFLEEVNEAPYRIDRWMTQLDLAGGFKNAAAVVIGICENCGPEHEDISLTLERTLGLHLHPLTIPAVTGYSIGHIRNQCTLPIGLQARLDTRAQTITLLEAAVT